MRVWEYLSKCVLCVSQAWLGSQLCVPVPVNIGRENVSDAECIESDLKRTAKILSAAGETCIVKQ